MEDLRFIFRKIADLPTFRAFHQKNYPLLFLSTLTLSIGHYMTMVALGWQVLEMTDSSFLLGILWVARNSPFLVFGFLAGALADKFDRRKLIVIIIVMMASCSFCLGRVILKEGIQIWYILILTSIMGSLIAFDMPTRQAFVVDIVGQQKAMSALSMNAVALRMMGVFGGVAAGTAIELMGVGRCFYIISLSYLFGIIPLLAMREMKMKVKIKDRSFWGDFFEAVIIIRKNQTVLTLAAMAIACEILGFSFISLLPIFARDILKAGAFGLGMLSTMFSVGSLLGVLILATLGDYSRKGQLILSIFMFFGIFLVLFSQSPWYQVSIFLILLVGAMAASFDAMQHTLLQLNVLEEQRGRAMGIWILSIGFGPVGFTLIGAMATFFGAQLAIFVNGMAIIIAFFALFIFVPIIRRV